MLLGITPKLQELVRRKVESGLYNNASEVIREALRLMAEQDQVYHIKLERLRGAIEAGEASGPATEFDFETFMKELDEEANEDGRA
jgi:antitoxin ParD1/3/4